MELEELLLQLREVENLEEQGDILHFLVVTYGLDHETGTMIEGSPVTIKDLLKDLYERACQQKNWALVRHTAGTYSHLCVRLVVIDHFLEKECSESALRIYRKQLLICW